MEINETTALLGKVCTPCIVPFVPVQGQERLLISVVFKINRMVIPVWGSNRSVEIPGVSVLAPQPSVSLGACAGFPGGSYGFLRLFVGFLSVGHLWLELMGGIFPFDLHPCPLSVRSGKPWSGLDSKIPKVSGLD